MQHVELDAQPVHALEDDRDLAAVIRDNILSRDFGLFEDRLYGVDGLRFRVSELLCRLTIRRCVKEGVDREVPSRNDLAFFEREELTLLKILFGLQIEVDSRPSFVTLGLQLRLERAEDRGESLLTV
ncbi:MAG: hypothetical protein WA966_07305 [Ornithinimicrobium sp.]